MEGAINMQSMVCSSLVISRSPSVVDLASLSLCKSLNSCSFSSSASEREHYTSPHTEHDNHSIWDSKRCPEYKLDCESRELHVHVHDLESRGADVVSRA